MSKTIDKSLTKKLLDDVIVMFKTALRASCELWIKNRRDEGMRWLLGMAGVM